MSHNNDHFVPWKQIYLHHVVCNPFHPHFLHKVFSHYLIDQAKQQKREYIDYKYNLSLDIDRYTHTCKN